MDYEKKYNEALERARALWQEAIEKEYPNDYLKDYETIFPELAESEDERIRRTLVEYFGPKVQLDFVRGVPIQKIRDWLEKQKEQKELPLMGGDTDSYFDDLRMTTKPLTSREWFDEGMKYAQRLQKEQKPLETPSPSVIYTEQGEVLAEQEPAWREEDEKIRKLLIWQVHRNIEDETNDLAQSVYDGIKGHDPDLEESIEDWKKCLAWLKSIPLSCPKSSDNWKPSEEQLNALNFAITYFIHDTNYKNPTELRELYDELLKLK